jgi:hypothetical protein
VRHGGIKPKPIDVHHLGPSGHEVIHELLLRIRTTVNFGEYPQLRGRTEDEVDTGASPPHFVRLSVAPVVYGFGSRGWLPLRAHIEQIDEESRSRMKRLLFALA